MKGETFDIGKVVVVDDIDDGTHYGLPFLRNPAKLRLDPPFGHFTVSVKKN